MPPIPINFKKETKVFHILVFTGIPFKLNLNVILFKNLYTSNVENNSHFIEPLIIK